MSHLFSKFLQIFKLKHFECNSNSKECYESTTSFKIVEIISKEEYESHKKQCLKELEKGLSLSIEDCRSLQDTEDDVRIWELICINHIQKDVPETLIDTNDKYNDYWDMIRLTISACVLKDNDWVRLSEDFLTSVITLSNNKDALTLISELNINDFDSGGDIDKALFYKLKGFTNERLSLLLNAGKIEPNTNIPSNCANGYEWVDLGLSVKWARCNVGANKNTSCGYFYAWGETSPKKNCSKHNYSYEQIPLKLDATHDVATTNWGEPWRMPTKEEFEELKNNCIWEWTETDGVAGYNVTANNGNSIFLPAAGSPQDESVDGLGDVGFYWSATVHSVCIEYAWYLNFNLEFRNICGNVRYFACSVRPVCQ